jgi:hypothetical protein
MFAIGLALFGYHKLRKISKEEANKTFVDFAENIVKNFL